MFKPGDQVIVRFGEHSGTPGEVVDRTDQDALDAVEDVADHYLIRVEVSGVAVVVRVHEDDIDLIDN
jgi:hypothetical protein